MSTLIGFGPDPAQGAAPRPSPARRRTIRLGAFSLALLLLLPAGGGSTSNRLNTTPARASATLAQIHPEALDAAAITGRARPALYSVVETFPEHQTAFAFLQQGPWTYLATTYQNVLRASDIDITHDFPKAGHTTVGGARVDPSFPVHQVVLVRHGSVTHRAQVVNAELLRDIAVLRIPGAHPVLPTECVGPQSPRIADRTYLFSSGLNRNALSPIRRFGRISTLLAPEQIQSTQGMARHGEGGPLVNIRGNAIGVGGRTADAFAGGADRAPAFTVSTDLNVAFELLGQTNVCEEDGEAAEGPTSDGLPAAEPLPRGRVAELAIPAVMSIETIENNGLKYGTGFGVHSDGTSTWLATNHHVLGDARFLTDPALTVRNGDVAYLAEVVASSKNLDLALVRVDGVLPTLPIACERTPAGAPIMAIGSPVDALSLRHQEDVFFNHLDRFINDVFGVFIHNLITNDAIGFSPWNQQGISSSFGRAVIEPHPDGLPRWQRYPYLEDTATFGRIQFSRFKDIKHNAKIYGGNSGGPLLNLRGEVVGVNYKGDRRGGRYAVNIRRLFGGLAAAAGIPNPCADVPDTSTPGPGGGPEPTPLPTDVPTISPTPLPSIEPPGGTETTPPEGT